MAARLELFAVAVGTVPDALGEATLDRAAADAPAAPLSAPIACVGWVSASDADEDRLVNLLTSLAESSGLFDAHVQGCGLVTPGDLPGLSDELAILTAAGDLEEVWRDVLAWGVAATVGTGRAIAWRMSYDEGGSVDDRADEYATAWSDAPTEGDQADTPWPDGRN